MTSLPEIDDLLCRILRGEEPAWPSPCDADFEHTFLDRAIHHGLQMLVYDLVNQTSEWQDWPESIRSQLAVEMRAAAAHDMLRSHCVSSLLGDLQQRNIPVLITKGEALARMIYTKPSLRARCDTDLFIDMKDIDRVRTALVDVGYTVIPPIYKSHQFSGVKEFSGASIAFDIHWRILNAPQFARTISFTQALEHSVPIAGLPGGRTLSIEHSLLLACMHRQGSAVAERGRLIWLYDIHLLALNMTTEQWKRFADKAVRLGVQGACVSGLKDARTRFMTEIPDDSMQTLAQTPARTLAKRFSTSNLSLLWDDMKSLPNRRTRRELIGELFFPSSGSLLKKYHKKRLLWLPLLYLQQVLGGMVKRLTLR